MTNLNKKKFFPTIDEFSDKDFINNFVFNKNVVRIVFKKLKIIDSSISEYHLLFFLDYCILNTTFLERSSKFNICSRTYSNCVWKIANISKSLRNKTNLDERFKFKVEDLANDSSGHFLTLVVDSIYIPFATSDQSFYNSNYKKGSGRGVKFQITCDSMGEVFSIHGPYKAPASDIAIFRETMTNFPFSEGERFIGDKGYSGESSKILTPHKENQTGLTSKQKLENKFIKRNHSVVENVFSLLRRFGFMDMAWATHLPKLKDSVFLIIYLYNTSIKLNKKLTDNTSIKDEKNKDDENDENNENNDIEQFKTDCTGSFS
ncbi:hypothetical protein RB653_009394 [Dictyostelium firmibasis]|uniref:DDE Tnp4 domain-containing protein n=1 Tax=Dictyostelium firmibasis TaxID=79012 RepID=A0AAN7UE81_9MYCE